jgi:hypothetical protein
MIFATMMDINLGEGVPLLGLGIGIEIETNRIRSIFYICRGAENENDKHFR